MQTNIMKSIARLERLAVGTEAPKHQQLHLVNAV